MMSNVNLAIIYYSSTGTNYQLARWAEEAASSWGAKVRVLKTEELAPMNAIEGNPAWKKHYDEAKDIPVAAASDIEWADAIIFSVPTRFGNIPSQMKQFLDTLGGFWAQGKTADKVVSAMASAGNAHGGQEQTILAMYTSMMHWGAIIVPPGYTDPSIYTAGGNPYGTTVTVDQDGTIQEDAEGAVRHQAIRTVEIASRLKSGNQ